MAVTGTSGFEDERPTRTERYEITAEDLLGRAVSDDVTVTVVGGQPDVDIRASRTRILSGDDVRISWTAENVRNVEVDGVAVTGTSGFEDERPTRTERYEITAEDLLGRAVSDDVTVTVVGGQPDVGAARGGRHLGLPQR